MNDGSEFYVKCSCCIERRSSHTVRSADGLRKLLKRHRFDENEGGLELAKKWFDVDQPPELPGVTVPHFHRSWDLP